MKLGLDRLLENPRRWLGGARVGLIANPTTTDQHLRHAVDLLAEHPDVELTLLFGPEHGIRSAVQDMVDVADQKDAVTGITEISLYGTTEASLTPQAEHLEQVDLLLFDVQDIGARYYTYTATMALAMGAAAQYRKKVVVLDRPNPIGGTQVEGGGLTPGLETFCGLYPVPQRHGMTVGELARLYNTTFGLGCDLEVVTMEGWQRRDYFDACYLPWVLPSPNMPTLDTAIVYPGMCLLEGTNLSEGRGTTRPFELFGAPWIDSRSLAMKLESCDLPGVIFRPCVIQPAFHKHAGELCPGLQLHVTDRQAFLPYRLGVALLWCLRQMWPDDFGWRTEPYEFRTDVPPIDLLTGKAEVREAIDIGVSLDRVIEIAVSGTETYDSGRAAALLYD